MPLPTKVDRQETHARLTAARTLLGPRVQELRDADEWQRWANLQVQEELAKQMEALASEENLETAARKMRELQGRWRSVALAPRTQGEAMWRRFKAAQDAVFARTSTFMAEQHAARNANLQKKQELCTRAEAMSASSDWVKTAAELQALQAQWKNIGAVSRGHEKALWERFRAACDGFFSRRQEDLKKRKDEWSGNLAQKEALCEEAERLAQSNDWDATAAQFKRLQAQWKSIGPVRRSKSEVVWQRFRTACDGFFDRYKHRDQIEIQEKAAARTSVIQDLENLVPADAADVAGPGGALRHGTEGAPGVAAGTRGAACPAAGPGHALPRRPGPPGVAVAGRFCRHRSRPGSDPQADGETAGARRAALVGTGRRRTCQRPRPPSCWRSGCVSAWPRTR